MTDQIQGVLQGLAYIALGVVILLIARVAQRIFLPYQLDKELTTHDNHAVGLAVIGHYLAVVIVFLGAVIGPEPETPPGWGAVGMSMLEVLAYAVGGIVALHVGEAVLDRIVLSKFSIRKELVDDRNCGTGAVVFGASIATALVIAGAVHGEGGGPLTALAFFGLGQIALIAFGAVYRGITKHDVHDEIERDNVAAGTAFGLSMIALGIVLMRAVVGDFIDWPTNLLDFAYYAIGGFIVIAVLRVITDRLFLPGSSLTHEIANDRNLNAAWMEGGLAIAVATMIFFLL